MIAAMLAKFRPCRNEKNTPAPQVVTKYFVTAKRAWPSHVTWLVTVVIGQSTPGANLPKREGSPTMNKRAVRDERVK